MEGSVIYSEVINVLYWRKIDVISIRVSFIRGFTVPDRRSFYFIFIPSCIFLIHTYYFFPPCRVFLITKLLFVCSIFVSFLLQFYVPMDFLEPQIVRMNYLVYKYPLRHEAIKTAIQLTFRTILVLVTGELITNPLICSHY